VRGNPDVFPLKGFFWGLSPCRTKYFFPPPKDFFNRSTSPNFSRSPLQFPFQVLGGTRHPFPTSFLRGPPLEMFFFPPFWATSKDHIIRSPGFAACPPPLVMSPITSPFFSENTINFFSPNPPQDHAGQLAGTPVKIFFPPPKGPPLLVDRPYHIESSPPSPLLTDFFFFTDPFSPNLCRRL